MPDRRPRWRPRAHTGTPTQPLLRVTNALGVDGSPTATLYILGPIDEMGAEWGAVSAGEFIAALNGVQAPRLDLRVNSGGGSFYEAVAMRAALVSHPARVTAFVDGLAASAASVLITGADTVVMARGAQQMIHRARSIGYGTAAEMRADADLLDKIDNDIAGFYLERSGQGTVESWLAAMDRETWLAADEAIACGLADELALDPVRQRDTEPVAASVDHWILATYRYAGRDKAPAPRVADEAPSVESAPGPELVDLPEPSTVTPPVAAEDVEPAPLTAPLLDDDAVQRIAEAVAERLAQRTPEAPAPASGGDGDGGNVTVLPVAAPTPETPAAPVAAAVSPTALPTAGPLQFDPAQFRAAIRKAASL